MLQKFCQFVQGKKLFLPEERILLTISGGLDSIVMADLFFNANFAFAIAHCNFQLRGKESDEDEHFVKSLAEQYKVPFFVSRFETMDYSNEKGISIQMAARELRYSWFEEVIQKENFRYFATAHHRDDVIETILLNLIKGTDIHGLTGIREKAGNAIRPMLFTNREEIRKYAEEKRLSWREDSSNLSTKYQRNYIRHEIIPALEKINPSLKETFELTIEKLKAAERIYSSSFQEFGKKAITLKEDVLYVNKKMLAAEKEPALFLFEILRTYGFNYHECLNLLNSSQAGKKICIPGYEVVNDRDYYILTKSIKKSAEEIEISEQDATIQLEDYQLSFESLPKEGYSISPSENTAQLDREKLTFPLKIRNWKEGDSFKPFGMKGKKKLSDFLSDLKIPLNLKQKIKVLVSGESIVWVIGYRIDERFRIHDDTRKILVIRKQNL